MIFGMTRCHLKNFGDEFWDEAGESCVNTKKQENMQGTRNGTVNRIYEALRPIHGPVRSMPVCLVRSITK